MDIELILLATVGISYCAYKWIKGKEDKHLFFIIAFIYSITGLEFIVHSENYIGFMQVLNTDYLQVMNTLLTMGMAILLDKMSYTSIKTRLKLS